MLEQCNFPNVISVDYIFFFFYHIVKCPTQQMSNVIQDVLFTFWDYYLKLFRLFLLCFDLYKMSTWGNWLALEALLFILAPMNRLDNMIEQRWLLTGFMNERFKRVNDTEQIHIFPFCPGTNALFIVIHRVFWCQSLWWPSETEFIWRSPALITLWASNRRVQFPRETPPFSPGTWWQSCWHMGATFTHRFCPTIRKHPLKISIITDWS